MDFIPYNSGGQYRMSDFVAYIPDFLKTEPDVVSLLQCMSDYLNNAYRNLRSTTEFELVRICTDTNLYSVKANMNALHEMFGTASARGEWVDFISVPRNNAKTDAVLGNASAEYPVAIRYAGEHADILPVASSLGISSETADGHVVYVTFTDGKTLAYYYDRESDSLIIDPMGTSQDPFDGSSNNPERMLSLKISDVGDVETRYLKKNGGIVYREVFFRIHIDDRKSIPNQATGTVTMPGTKEEPTDVLVDYMDRCSQSGDNYRSAMSFSDTTWKNWKDGYPTGMFYFRETSETNLMKVGADNGVLASDPAGTGSVERYAVTSLESIAGTVKVTLPVPPTVYNDGFCYLVNRKTGLRLGEFRMSLDTPVPGMCVGGKYSLILKPTKAVNIPSDTADVDLVVVPLFGTAMSLDGSKERLVLRWTSQLPMCGSSLITGKQVRFVSAAMFGDDSPVVPGFTPSLALCTGSTIFLPNASLMAGDLVYCKDTLWEGVAKIAYGGTAVTVSGQVVYKYVLADGVICRNVEELYNEGARIDIYRVTGGLATVSLEDCSVATVVGCGGITEYVVLADSNDLTVRHLLKVESVSDGMMKFTCSHLDCGKSYFVYPITVGKDYAGNVVSYIYDDECVGAILGYYSGAAMLTAGYAIGTDSETGSTALFEIYDPVPLFDGAGVYAAGDTVFYDGKLYVAGYGTSISDGETPSSSSAFREDRVSRFAYQWKTVRNAFIPYCGPFSPLEYGEEPDYSSGMAHVILPMYIRKVDDIRLKFGARDREYMYYPYTIDKSKRTRNGFVEIHSSDLWSDIVDSDLLNFVDAKVPYTVLRRGYAPELLNDVDSITAVNNHDGSWTVNVVSSGHGLITGVEVSLSGIVSGNGDEFDDAIFNLMDVRITVLDGDRFTYTVSPSTDYREMNMVAVSADEPVGKCVYSRKYHYDVVGAEVGESTGTVSHYVRFEAPYAEGVLLPGDKIEIIGGKFVTADGTDVEIAEGTYEVISDPDQTATDTDKYICVECPVSVQGETHLFPVGITRLLEAPVDGDLVYDGTSIWKVNAGEWERVDRKGLVTPVSIFARENFVDVSVTNPAISEGEMVTAKSIRYMGDGLAMVELSHPIDYISRDNAEFIEGSMEVRISNVYPTEYNGWHVIKTVYGPSYFAIAVNDANGLIDGAPVDNRSIEVRPGTWYHYDAERIAWDKVSSKATYSVANTVIGAHNGDSGVGENVGRTYVETSLPHGLRVGDNILFDISGSAITEFNSDSTVSSIVAGLCEARVVSVTGDTRFAVEGAVAGNITTGKTTVCRGWLLTKPGDNLKLLEGTYSKELASYDGKQVKFSDGNIVVLAAQEIPVEMGSWKVVGNSTWVPVRKKRVLKISELSVDMRRNPDYDQESENGMQSEYEYTPVDHVTAMKTCASTRMNFMVFRRFARNYNFSNVSLENIDTTNSTLLQFSSKYDYGSVAPRSDLAEGFDGIPDMGYPLVEKVERLSYLRDASVIDFSLIEYLGRFMGYDIATLAKNIEQNQMYNSVEERVEAVRRSVENLPQYYSLGGTETGLDMMLSAFGIIGKAITKWTEISNPYGELISSEEVDSRRAYDPATGEVWVPTPHIDLEIPIEDVSGVSVSGVDAISDLKNNIRSFKPINVVFDDIVMTIKSEINMVASLTCGEGKIYSNQSALLVNGNPDTVELDDTSAFSARCTI